MKKKKIGLYGGTFSPPHFGHIRAAESFLSGVKLDELYVMPDNVPPHKRIDAGDDPKIRLEMCRAAFGDMPKVTVSDYEIEKQGVSYTIDTLEHLTENGDVIYLLCGDDMFLTLESWRRGEDILRLARIVLMRRYGKADPGLAAKAKEYRKKYGTKVIMLKSEPCPMSSTEVRERVSRGEDISAYTPKAVEDIIVKYGLYGRKNDVQ